MTAETEDEHLADIPEGAGCTEIWEHLSEVRKQDRPDPSANE